MMPDDLADRIAADGPDAWTEWDSYREVIEREAEAARPRPVAVDIVCPHCGSVAGTMAYVPGGDDA